jgi:hypothetical protein
VVNEVFCFAANDFLGWNSCNARYDLSNVLAGQCQTLFGLSVSLHFTQFVINLRGAGLFLGGLLVILVVNCFLDASVHQLQFFLEFADFRTSFTLVDTQMRGSFV